jgi:hypothetical protein
VTDDRNPALERLFDVANQDLQDDAFAARVMARIDGQRRLAIVSWIGVGLVMLACVGLLAPTLVGAISLLGLVLPRSLVELHDGWVSALLTPVNSIAGVVALTFLGLRMAYRKIFS